MKLIRPRLLVMCLVLSGGIPRTWIITAAEPFQRIPAAESAMLEGFRNPPREARTRLFWRVFGPAWTPEEIDYQLETIKDAGVGGVTAFFMYPFAEEGGEIHNQRYLSSEFLATLKHAATKARELDLRFGVAGGTGWPFGGPSVSPQDAAQGVWQETVKPALPGGTIQVPQRRPGEKVLAVFSGSKQLSDAAWKLLADAHDPKSTGEVALVVAGPTAMQVKRAAFGAEGLVLDHYNQRATERYLNSQVSPLLSAAPGLIESVFCDSLEVYRGNWTEGLPGRFKRARGYSLPPRLAELFDGSAPKSADVRFDFWRTLAEATEEEFTRTLFQWAHRRGIRLEMEAYGTPPNPLTAARYIDVPTGEQYEWKGFSLSRLAASGAHLAGRRVIGAEAWTWMGLPNRLGDSLSDAKLCSDLHYLAGINDLTGVDFAYSPRSAGQPGWLPYYGPVFNQNNPQWPWFKHLVSYTSRCSWLLRQGRPVADVALYLPVEDKFAFGSTEQMLLGFELRDHFVSGPKTDEFGLQTALKHRSDLIDGLFSCGMNYDGIDFFTMNRIARVHQGHLVAGDGDYTTLVLPRIKGIESEALTKIAAFCRSGGALLVSGSVPEHAYGLRPSKSPQYSRGLLVELFGEHPDAGRSWSRPCGRGHVCFVPDERDSLRRVLREFQPDVLLEPAQPDVGFVHRRAGPIDIYFLANTSDHPCVFAATVRSQQRTVEIWDALTGDIHAGEMLHTDLNRARVELSLPPRGSTFLVLGRRSAAQPAKPTRWETEDLAIRWNLAFQPSVAKTPSPHSLSNLVSWTEWPEAQFFSGTVTYSGELIWNRPPPRQAWLVFSEVHEAAKVRLNGVTAGVAWTPPCEVEISPWLKPGTNSLSIDVANLPLNLFLGTPDRDLAPLRALYGNRFPAPEEKRLHLGPALSGLMGPVRLRFELE